MEVEGGLTDLLSDTFSCRIVWFFFIPKVKFMMHLISHAAYIACLFFALIPDRLSEAGQLQPRCSVEVECRGAVKRCGVEVE